METQNPVKVTKILIKFKINADLTKKLQDAGVQLGFRTQSRQNELIDQHTEDAINNNIDAFRFNRTDAAGNLQSDSGTEIFLQKVKKEFAISLIKMQSLEELDLVLSGINFFKKEKDKNPFFELSYADKSQIVDGIKITTEQQGIIDELFKTTFASLFIYRNIDKPITVNASNIISKEATCFPYFINEKYGDKLTVLSIKC